MDYQKHYDKLIERSRNRELDCYTEKHHIVPRCMGGSDDVDNIAVLTGPEHFVAHQLLVKLYPEHRELIAAVRSMCNSSKTHRGRRSRNKMVGWLRKRHAEYMSEIQSGKRNSQYGSFWITNGSENRKLSKGSEIPDGWHKGRKVTITPKILRAQKALRKPKYCCSCNKKLSDRTIRANYCPKCRHIKFIEPPTKEARNRMSVSAKNRICRDSSAGRAPD